MVKRHAKPGLIDCQHIWIDIRIIGYSDVGDFEKNAPTLVTSIDVVESWIYGPLIKVLIYLYKVLDEGYFKCWQGLQKHFTGENNLKTDPEFYKNLGPQPINHPRAATE